MDLRALAVCFLFTFATVQGLVCPCSGDLDKCVNKRNFIALRWINATLVPSVPSPFPTIGDQIFFVMNANYASGLDYFTKALAQDGNPTIAYVDNDGDGVNDNDNFSKNNPLWCYHSDMTDLSFDLPSGNSYTVDLEIRSRALEKGVSVEICECRDKDRPKANGFGYRRCNDELINYLRERSEYRMSIIEGILTDN